MPTPTPTPTPPPAPTWADDFDAPGYVWQRREVFNLFITAAWERYCAAYTVPLSALAPIVTPGCLPPVSVPPAAAFARSGGTASVGVAPPVLDADSVPVELQGFWLRLQLWIDGCTDHELTQVRTPDLPSLFTRFAATPLKRAFACLSCYPPGTPAPTDDPDSSNRPRVPDADVEALRYRRSEFRLAAGIDVDRGWRRKRAREIASLDAAADSGGNPAAAGQVARLQGAGNGMYPRPENAGVACYSYRYVADAPDPLPAGDPGGYPRWVRLTDGTPPDTLDSADAGTKLPDKYARPAGYDAGETAGDGGHSGDYAGGWMLNQIRDALNVLNVTTYYPGRLGPVFSCLKKHLPEGEDSNLYDTLQQGIDAANTVVCGDPDPDNPPYVRSCFPAIGGSPVAGSRTSETGYRNYDNAGNPINKYGSASLGLESSGFKWVAARVPGSATAVKRDVTIFLAAGNSPPGVQASGGYSYIAPDPCDPVPYDQAVFGSPWNQFFVYKSWGNTDSADLVGDTLPAAPVWAKAHDYLAELPVVLTVVDDNGLPVYGGSTVANHGGAQIISGIVVANWWAGYTLRGTTAPDATLIGDKCVEDPGPTAPPPPAPTPTPTPTPVASCGTCAPCCFLVGKGPVTWTPPCNGTLRLAYNDAAGRYADNAGQFVTTGSVTDTVLGSTEPDAPQPPAVLLSVTGGTPVALSAAGTVDNGDAGDAHFAGGPDGAAGTAGTCPTCACPAANYAGLVALFTPAAVPPGCLPTGTHANGPADAASYVPAVNQSRTTTRCRLYVRTGVQLSSTDSSGTFTTPFDGYSYAWANVVTSPPPAGSIAGGGCGCPDDTGWITITRLS